MVATNHDLAKYPVGRVGRFRVDKHLAADQLEDHEMVAAHMLKVPPGM